MEAGQLASERKGGSGADSRKGEYLTSVLGLGWVDDKARGGPDNEENGGKIIGVGRPRLRSDFEPRKFLKPPQREPRILSNA